MGIRYDQRAIINAAVIMYLSFGRYFMMEAVACYISTASVIMY